MTIQIKIDNCGQTPATVAATTSLSIDGRLVTLHRVVTPDPTYAWDHRTGDDDQLWITSGDIVAGGGGR